MSTIRTPAQAWSLEDHDAILDCSGMTHQVHHRDRNWLDFVAFPAETLHARVASEVTVDTVARAICEDDLCVWDDQSSTSQDLYRSQARAALKALRFEVTQ